MPQQGEAVVSCAPAVHAAMAVCNMRPPDPGPTVPLPLLPLHKPLSSAKRAVTPLHPPLHTPFSCAKHPGPSSETHTDNPAMLDYNNHHRKEVNHNPAMLDYHNHYRKLSTATTTTVTTVLRTHRTQGRGRRSQGSKVVPYWRKMSSRGNDAGYT